jgi:tRNA pseudouridine55 synthase
MADRPSGENGRHDDSAAGVFLIDKPRGATSFSVVRQVRRLLGIKKVGHAGTLDPFATGLLIVCAGRPATRLVERFMAGKKVYAADIQLGVETETLDPEGRIVAAAEVPPLDRDDIERCLESFTGTLLQVPPPFSAVKHKGKPLYHYARKGVMVAKEPRRIEIYSLKPVEYDAEIHRLKLEVVCSRGTYIRVLAADIGARLGCGAHLRELRRLASGSFSVRDSLDGGTLTGSRGLEELLGRKISPARAEAMLRQEENAPAV